MTALHDLPAHELLAAYRQRTLSPVEVTQAVLAHIARWEPHIQATYLLRPEAALAQARASEARWHKGEPQGLLDGVPSTIKENIATEGDPTPLGTAAVELVPAAADAPLGDRALQLTNPGTSSTTPMPGALSVVAPGSLGLHNAKPYALESARTATAVAAPAAASTPESRAAAAAKVLQRKHYGQRWK